MSFYSDVSADANELLLELGQPLLVTYCMTLPYDPATSQAQVVESNQTGRGVILDYGTSEIDGSLISVGDKKLLLSVIGISIPSLNDKVTDVNGVTYTLKAPYKNLSPAGLSVLYQFNAR